MTSALIIAILLFSYVEISQLKSKINALQTQVNELCQLTNHEQLSSYYISDKLKEKVLHLKNSGKPVRAIIMIHAATDMSLTEAKQYVDAL